METRFTYTDKLGKLSHIDISVPEAKTFSETIKQIADKAVATQNSLGIELYLDSIYNDKFSIFNLSSNCKSKISSANFLEYGNYLNAVNVAISENIQTAIKESGLTDLQLDSSRLFEDVATHIAKSDLEFSKIDVSSILRQSNVIVSNSLQPDSVNLVYNFGQNKLLLNRLDGPDNQLSANELMKSINDSIMNGKSIVIDTLSINNNMCKLVSLSPVMETKLEVFSAYDSIIKEVRKNNFDKAIDHLKVTGDITNYGHDLIKQFIKETNISLEHIDTYKPNENVLALQKMYLLMNEKFNFIFQPQSKTDRKIEYALKDLISDEKLIETAAFNDSVMTSLPPRLKNQETYDKIFSLNKQSYNNIPNEYRTISMSKDAFSNTNLAISPEHIKLLDSNDFLQRVKTDGLYIQHIPEGKVDQEIVSAAVANNPEAIKHSPSELIDEQIVLSLFSNKPDIYKSLPDTIKKAVNQVIDKLPEESKFSMLALVPQKTKHNLEIQNEELVKQQNKAFKLNF